MANVLHRTTNEYRASVNTPDYPVGTWIINPDLTAVAGQPPRYWTITGDVVTLMTGPEQAAVDASTLAAQRDAIAAQLDLIEDIMRAFTLALLDEINLHATRVTAILTAVDNSSTYAALRTAIAAIPDIPQRTVAQLKTTLRAKLGT